jgi:hypothetical protein
MVTLEAFRKTSHVTELHLLKLPPLVAQPQLPTQLPQPFELFSTDVILNGLYHCLRLGFGMGGTEQFFHDVVIEIQRGSHIFYSF